jgi:hypothetical protein
MCMAIRFSWSKGLLELDMAMFQDFKFFFEEFNLVFGEMVVLR